MYNPARLVHLNLIENPPMMLTTTFRVPLLRSLAHRSAAIHTLPKLPYSYDVGNSTSPTPRAHPLPSLLGSRAAHLCRDYGTAPHEAPPDLCERPERC